MTELIIKNNDLPINFTYSTDSPEVTSITFLKGYWYVEHEYYNQFDNPFSKILTRQFPKLRKINFQECEFDDTFFKLFSKGYAMRNLLTLEFFGFDSVIELDQIKILLKSKLIANLTSLSIGPIETHKEVLNVILSSKNLSRLKTLKVGLQDHKPERFTAPRRVPPRLSSLELYGFNLSKAIKLLEGLFLWLHMHNLKNLNLNNALIGVQGAYVLSMSPSMKNVEKLGLQYSHIQDEGLMHLARSKFFKKLRELNLRRNDLTENAIKHLCHSTFRHTLVSLELEELYWNGKRTSDLLRATTVRRLIMESNFISAKRGEFSPDNFIQHMISADIKQPVTDLVLTAVPSRPNSTYRFLKTRKCEKMNNLVLNYYAFGNMLGKAFKVSTSFSHLQKLSLKYCWIRNSGLNILTSSKYLRNIRDLDLSSNKLTSRALLFLLYAPFIRNLRLLVLNNNNFEKKPQHVKLLFSSEKCKGLEMLSLEACELTNVHLHILLEKSKLRGSLRKLNISHNEQIDENGVEDWECLKSFGKLKALGIHGTSISTEALDYMYSAIPDLEVLY